MSKGCAVREGEGVMGTYCIQPENNDIIVVVVDLHHMDATSWAGTRPDTCWQLVRGDGCSSPLIDGVGGR